MGILTRGRSAIVTDRARVRRKKHAESIVRLMLLGRTEARRLADRVSGLAQR
jgi:hypothetical protein